MPTLVLDNPEKKTPRLILDNPEPLESKGMFSESPVEATEQAGQEFDTSIRTNVPIVDVANNYDIFEKIEDWLIYDPGMSKSFITSVRQSESYEIQDTQTEKINGIISVPLTTEEIETQRELEQRIEYEGLSDDERWLIDNGYPLEFITLLKDIPPEKIRTMNPLGIKAPTYEYTRSQKFQLNLNNLRPNEPLRIQVENYQKLRDVYFDKLQKEQVIEKPRKYKGWFDELGRNLARMGLKTYSGIFGTIATASESAIWDKESFQNLADWYYNVSEIRPLRPGISGPPIRQFTAQVIGSVIPYVAAGTAISIATGTPYAAFFVGFSVEGDEIYRNAKKQGLSEEDAQMLRFIGGSINGAIETMQISGIIKFAKTGKGSISAIAAAARNLAWNEFKVAGKDLTYGLAEHILREALEETLQELVTTGAAIYTGEELTGEEIIKRLGTAAAGGAFMGLVFGGGGKMLQTITEGKGMNESPTKIPEPFRIKTKEEAAAAPQQPPIPPSEVAAVLVEPEVPAEPTVTAPEAAVAPLTEIEKTELRQMGYIIPEEPVKPNIIRVPKGTTVTNYFKNRPSPPVGTILKQNVKGKEYQVVISKVSPRKIFNSKTGLWETTSGYELQYRLPKSGRVEIIYSEGEIVSAEPTPVPIEAVRPAEAKPETGKPYSAVLYRGVSLYTPVDTGYFGAATYFTPDKSLAEYYADTPKGGEVKQYEVNLKNPFVGQESSIGQFVTITQAEREKYTEQGMSQEEYSKLESQSITDEMKRQGYDGFIIVGEKGNVLEVGSFVEGIKPPVEAVRPAEAKPEALPKGLEAEVPPQEPRLEGLREAGGTTIVSDVAAEIASLSKKAYRNPIIMVKELTEIIKRNIKSGKAHIKTLGKAGQKIVYDMDGSEKSIVYQATKKVNNDELDIRAVYKGVNKTNRELIAKTANGRVKNQPKWIVERANKLREILDRAMNEATALGMQRKVGGKKILVAGSGKAFPQVPNDDGIVFLEESYAKGKSSAKVFAWAQDMVSRGKYDNIDMAINALQRYRDSLHRGLNPYLEMERVEIPEEYIEWDGTKILPGLFERNWLTIEGVRKWGNDFEKLGTYIEQIRNEFGNHEAKRIKVFIDVAFGKMSDASKESQQICNLIRAYQFQTKVGLSPLTIMRNMFDRIAKGFTISPISTIRTFIEYPPLINQFIDSSQKLEEEMIRIGAVFGHGSISEGYEAGRVLTELTSSPFTASERGNQVTIALVQMHKMYNDIAALKGKEKLLNHIFDKVSYIWGGGSKQIETRLKYIAGEEVLAKIKKGEELTQDEIGFILHNAVKNKAFPMILSTKPLWYDNHPVIKLFAQFKTWPVRQLDMVWNDVVKYTFKTGDFSRMLGFLTGTFIAGELYNILRDFLYDKKESVLSMFFSDDEEKDYITAILNDMLDGGIVGMLADFTFGIKDWVTGVSFRTAHNVWDTGNYIAKSPRLSLQALEKLLSQELTPYRQIKFQIDKIDRALINEGNITKEYTRWRAEGWDWSNKKQNPTLYDKIKAYTDDVINGKVDYGIGEDTLAYELAARQIVVGDIDDAAEYLAYIITNSDKPLNDSVANIKHSRNNRSPLGKVAEKDRANFFKKYSKEDKDLANQIQKTYIDNYQKAIDEAIKIAKEKGFETKGGKI